MIMRNRTITIILLVLVLVSTIFVSTLNIDIPNEYTARELFNKMADNLLKISALFCYLTLVYFSLLAIGGLSFIMYTLYKKIFKKC